MKTRLFYLVLGIMVMSQQFFYGQTLVNPNANAAARKLKALLDSVYQTGKIISGQMDDSYLTYIKNTTGKEPALMGYDFNGICPSQGGNHDADKAIRWVKYRGGIAQFNWHWISPDGNGDFYTNNFNLADALNNPNSQSYKNILRDIDLVAAECKRMQDSGIAIIWRPLHEAEGKWFWWGKSGGEACKKLYRLMYDRMVNYHGLNNLIWAWTSYGTTKENWYPGDDVVDLIVYDYPDYSANGSWSQFQSLFGGKGKLFGIGEDGKLIDPNILSSQHWLYFMTWAYMVKDPSEKDGKNPVDWLKKVYNDPRVITLDDLRPPISNTKNIATGKPVMVSSTESGGVNKSNYANDGNYSTRWSSEYTDPQWIEINLGKRYNIQRVIIHWEVASAKKYIVQESNDRVSWTNVITKDNMRTGSRIDTLNNLSGGSQYVRIYGVTRTTTWGYSIYEIEIEGEQNPEAVPVAETNNSTGGDTTGSSGQTGNYCNNPLNIPIPFKHDGPGEYCWKFSGVIKNINSWSTEKVYINGVEFTNKWSDKLPLSTDGYYYVYYKASIPWSHFEINGINGQPANIPVTGISLNFSNITVAVGGSQNLMVNILPENATDKRVSWYSSDENIAVVDANGKVIGKAVGTAMISVKSESVGLIATCEVTVSEAQINPDVYCLSYIPVQLPFVKEGIGEFCFETSVKPVVVNSWALDKLAINGTDLSNKWSDQMPQPINGKWYIYYKGSLPWSHFEAMLHKSAEEKDMINMVNIFPNPFTEYFVIRSSGTDKIVRIEVYNTTGALVKILTENELDNSNELKLYMPQNGDAAYIVRVVTESKVWVGKMIQCR